MSTASSGQPSPAERYADYRRDRQHPVLRDFAAGYSFPLDDFQVQGLP